MVYLYEYLRNLLFLFSVIVNVLFFPGCFMFLKSAYLDVFQKKSPPLVCRMILCFLLSTVPFILLQNHLILVSCELFEVAIFCYLQHVLLSGSDCLLVDYL